jgi:tetratricopeptide (TPR) repeat protein
MKKFWIILALVAFFTFVIGWQSNQLLQANVYKDIGEKLFLTYHRNSLAIWFLENSKLKNSRDSETFFLLGRLYFVENNLEKSLDNFNKAIQLDPTNKRNYYGRGLTYGFLSPLFYSEAAKDFQTYIDLDNSEASTTGTHFAIREGGKTVGAGVVTKIIA